MKILVTCFEPFGGDSVNSSRLAVDLLPDAIGEHAIRKLPLPVSFDRCRGIVFKAITEQNPDIIIMTGQAKRDAVCLERQAINRAISQKPDNDGKIAGGEKIYPDAADTIRTIFPVDSLVSTLTAQTEMPIKASDSAGTFVCNRLYFDVLHRLPAKPALFVHLPLTPAQAAARGASAPSLSAQSSALILQHLIPLLPPHLA